MKRGVLIKLISASFILFLQIIAAEHQTSPNSFSLEINEVSSLTIQITNTDTEDADPITSANITQIGITLPSSLIFTFGTNSTDSLSDFTNNSATLTWTNISYVAGSSTGGSNTKTFSFNVDAASMGIFNITVNTTNSTGTSIKKIPLTISDSENPEINLVGPANNKTETDGTVLFECDAADNFNLNMITLYIYSSNNTIYCELPYT